VTTPTPGGGPTVRRMLVGAQLRRLREARGVTREEAGYVIRGSESKISRLELGRVSFKERDVSDLLTLYGVTDNSQRDTLLTMAREANDPGWWHAFDDVVASWFEMYVGLEQAASLLRLYEIQFIPGLLQTEDYTRAVTTTGIPDALGAEVERRVAVRMTRQKILTRDDPPKVWAVLDEAALRRPTGGRRVLKAQIAHLLELTDNPNVTIQVMPFRLGGHAADGGSFTILRFSEPDLHDIVYVEQLCSAVYLEKREHLDRYAATMDRLSVDSLTPELTIELLRKVHAQA
jgi:transcriptional regulator with XRE-family HTH domain